LPKRRVARLRGPDVYQMKRMSERVQEAGICPPARDLFGVLAYRMQAHVLDDLDAGGAAESSVGYCVIITTA